MILSAPLGEPGSGEPREAWFLGANMEIGEGALSEPCL